MNTANGQKVSETVRLSSDGRIVYCGARLLQKMLESGCSDAEIVLYMYYLLTMTVNNNILINLPLKQIRKDLHWGDNKLEKAKASLAKIGLIKNHTIRDKQGIIRCHRLVVFTGVNDAQITRTPETIGMETRVLEGKSERFPPAPPSNSNTSSLKPTSLTGNTISILTDTSFPNTDSPLRFPSGRSDVDGVDKSKEKKAITISPEEFISLLPDNCKGNAELETSCREFIQFRRESYPKEPFTALAARKALKRFVKLGRATPEELTESIDFAITKPYTCFYPRPVWAKGGTQSNGATKTCIQPNEDSLALYWGRSLARHTSKGRNPADFSLCGCKTPAELLTKLERRMDTVWHDFVGQETYHKDDVNYDNRLAFYRQEVPKILNFINNIPDVPENNHKELFDNPMELFLWMDVFLPDEYADFRTMNPRAISFGRAVWLKFVAWIQEHRHINLTTGRRTDLR